MSSEAPPPPPSESADSPDAGGSDPTVTLPASTESPARVRTSLFDSEVLEDSATSPRTATSPVGARSAAPAAPASAERPQLRNAPTTAGTAAGPRRVRLSVTRVDPWSVMKLSFLLSVAIGIMIVVAAALVWTVLDSNQVFGKLYDLFEELRVTALMELMQFVEFDAVMSMAVLVAVLDIVLLTALSTIMALLYNIVSALVGGVKVTLTDE